MSTVGDRWQLPFGKVTIMNHDSADGYVYIDGHYSQRNDTFIDALEAIDKGVKHGGYYQMVKIIATTSKEFKGTYTQLKKIVEQIEKDNVGTKKKIVEEKREEFVKLKQKGILGRLFCKHDYSLLQNITMKSEFEVVKDAGKVPNSHCSLTRRFISDYKCNKCGKIKRLTATTPK